MTTSTPTVLVLGGTGKTGSRLVAKLAKPGLCVRTAARRSADAPFDWNNPTTYRSALEGVDRVYLMTPVLRQAGSTDLVGNFLDHAAAARVQHVTYLSAYGMDEAPPEVGPRAIELAVNVVGGARILLRGKGRGHRAATQQPIHLRCRHQKPQSHRLARLPRPTAGLRRPRGTPHRTRRPRSDVTTNKWLRLSRRSAPNARRGGLGRPTRGQRDCNCSPPSWGRWPTYRSSTSFPPAIRHRLDAHRVHSRLRLPYQGRNTLVANASDTP
jgi:hypothetical protein